jgi:D-proline reductase (dithiol) PrdB
MERGLKERGPAHEAPGRPATSRVALRHEAPTGRSAKGFAPPGDTRPVATLSDLSLKNRLFMATYRYRTLDPVPFVTPRKPLHEARVALVTTGAVYAPGQEPFDEEKKGGDVSFRVIPRDTDVTTLGIAHKSDAFDQTGFRLDRNLGFPLDRLREMEAAGVIGSLAPRAISFMGSISAPGRLVKETAPVAVDTLEADDVDVALLVPL